jgi:hypothetical protein
MVRKMANGKSSMRVNGRNGESMWVDDELLSFRTGGKVETMPLEGVSLAKLVNVEEARSILSSTELIPHGAWTQKTESSGKKTAYVMIQGRANCWIMEVTDSQRPNAYGFVTSIKPQDDEDKGEGYIPGRVINTPLGALFTIGSIACVFGAYFLVFQFELPIPGIIVAMAGLIMFFNIK